jgi:oligoribonuclease
MKKASLLWVDLEMTGLDPASDQIIEVGAIATDWDFREVARFAAVVKVPQTLIEARLTGPFWDAHAASRDALIAQNPSGQSARTVENALIKFVQDNFTHVKDLSAQTQKTLRAKNPHLKDDDIAPVYLAGNSIHQDQKFIAREWPRLNKMLHYRQLDVSAWKIIMENRGVHFIKPEDHRAMADIEGSIAELKYYLKYFKAGQ